MKKDGARRTGSMGTTDAERKAGLEHISYEFRMLVGAISIEGFDGRLATIVETPLAAEALANGVVALRALHARNLAEFLLRRADDADYLSAADYFPDFKVLDRQAVGRVLDRASGEAAHLSKSRVADDEHHAGTKSKAWPLSQFFPLLQHALAFVDRLLASGRLDWNPVLRLQLIEAQGACRLLLGAANAASLSMATGMAGPVRR
jgi:hypothetical protein